MLKKKALYFLVLIGIILCICIAYWQLFRPVIFAKTISKLNIPLHVKVVAFTEQWSDFSGNGYALSKLKVDDEELRKIVKQCQLANYRMLPVDQTLLSYSDENLDELISKRDSGFYRATILMDQFSIVIVNIRQRTITTYTSIF